MKRSLIFIFIVFISSGCMKRCLYREEVSDFVRERICQDVVWGRCESMESSIESAACKELSMDEAVQIALLNHPHIQALFERFGIAQAELFQAGLFRNPIYDILFRFPTESGLHTDIEFSVALHFLDVFFVPLRKKVATFELKKVESAVAHDILDHAFHVEETYVALQAEEYRCRMLADIVELLEGEAELALSLAEAGNINAKDLEIHQKRYLSAQISLQESKMEKNNLAIKLNQLLGFENKCVEWRIRSELPMLPCQECVLCCLEDRALSSRLDLTALRWEMASIAKTAALKQWWAYADPMVGVGGEREPEGFWIIGPGIGGEIPIFDFGQAERTKIRALYRQSWNHFMSLRLNILEDVQRSYNNLCMIRSTLLHYQNNLLPILDDIFDSSQRLYNVMDLDVFELIESKLEQYRTQVDYLAQMRDYWIERVHLKRAVGGII